MTEQNCAFQKSFGGIPSNPRMDYHRPANRPIASTYLLHLHTSLMLQRKSVAKIPTKIEQNSSYAYRPLNTALVCDCESAYHSPGNYQQCCVKTDGRIFMDSETKLIYYQSQVSSLCDCNTVKIIFEVFRHLTTHYPQIPTSLTMHLLQIPRQNFIRQLCPA